MRLAEFLASVPPGVEKKIDELFKKREPAYLNAPNVSLLGLDIEIYCDNRKYKGTRFFYAISTPQLEFKQYLNYNDVYLDYWCRNCGQSKKTFALRVTRGDSSSNDGVAIKFGEMPSFGPPVPSRVVSLIGPDREIFLRGRRAENQGLGVGAFAYYRRVVENQKGRLIGKIAEVAKRLGGAPEVLEILEQAARETQFSKAVGDVKAAMPHALLIDGHNPLTLLHSALSEGLHAKTDEDCLEIATSIRVILTELAERITITLKDEAELTQALNNLMRRSNS
ncbi:MAG: hypothetical protein M3P37_01025 [Actinomycetota bacterium]|nr:hypothetical protein [Actinomycetota bacterium]